MLLNKLNKQFIILDGAFGTMAKNFIKAGSSPELLSLTNPEIVKDIHKQYLENGSDIIYANTFGANRKKFNSKTTVKEIIEKSLQIAKSAIKNYTDKYVALDIGPIGELIEPYGNLTKQEAYDIFKEIILAGKNLADLIVVETMTNLNELKIALLCAKENCNLPILSSMSFDKNLRTFSGATPASYVLTCQPFADIIGINCSDGPDNLYDVMKEISKWTDKPLMIKANAGLPDMDGNYNISAKEFANCYQKYVDLGVSFFGGCCGTTPKYIKEIQTMLLSNSFCKKSNKVFSGICSSTKVVNFDQPKIVGERINPTGKKLFKQALINQNYNYIKEQALLQAECFADILDVNTGIPDIDETQILTKVACEVESVVSLPLMIDSKNPLAIENALRNYTGKAIINSVTGEKESLNKILPIAKKYGSAIIGLTIDDNGIPKNTFERIEIAKKIICECEKYNIPKEDIFIDPLTMTVSTEREQANFTLDAIEILSKQLKVNTVLGVSNISFGLPSRNFINQTFLILALSRGLTLAIINPNVKENTNAFFSFAALNNQDENFNNYINYCNSFENTDNTTNIVNNSATFNNCAMSNSPAFNNCAMSNNSAEKFAEKKDDLCYAILNGLKTSKDITTNLLKNMPSQNIITEYIMPSLDKVGELFEKGKLFLPQLIMSAESAKLSFDAIKNSLQANTSVNLNNKIIVATVKGDVHDIGKNIVKLLLENYGFNVIDLGKDVDKFTIVDQIIKNNVKLIGLSALMTTTAKYMEEIILEIKKNNLTCKVLIGGAVISDTFKEKIGADYYAKDANETVKIARNFFNV